MAEHISDYFTGVAIKRLSQVEIEPNRSNQHEFNGIKDFKAILGEEKITLEGHFLYLTDDDEENLDDRSNLTWYDSRKNHPTRTEHRLYYTANAVTAVTKAGDLMVIGFRKPDNIVVLIADEGSTIERQLMWLFSFKETPRGFAISNFEANDVELTHISNRVLNSIGVEVKSTAPDFLDLLLDKFGSQFPSTKVFSAFARSTVSNVDPIDQPDLCLFAWLEQEEMLFRTLERHIVTEKLQQGFNENVDEFISFSLAVQNRRKSRAGYAFEHHLAEIFDANQVRYSRGAKTERNNKPDFLFPGINFYNTEQFPVELLVMLGVKTSAKDRWRQILSEADRINLKHLITLEPAISKNQTDEMKAQSLQLVVPQPIFDTYLPEQHAQLITLADFLQVVSGNQKKSIARV